MCCNQYDTETHCKLDQSHLTNQIPQSKRKGTRKGSHKAKQGHSFGVDFSMGYVTEIEDNSVIKLRFCFAFNL